MRSGIKPGITSSQLLDCQIATLKINIVDGCNLQFATRGGFERSGNINDFIVVKYSPVTAQEDLGLIGFSSMEIALPVVLSNSTTP